jgi:hypothetical protein
VRIAARLFQRPKLGEALADMQDAAAVDAGRGLAAIADGATDAAFQRLWADLLVQGWLEDPPGGEQGPDFEAWLAVRRERWQAAVPWDRLPWHGARKAQETGGLATLLGLCWEPRHNGPLTLAALAAGDCCVLLLDASGALRHAWPIADPDAFSQMPMLLSSLHPPPAEMWERGLLLETEFALAEGELLMLATDAAAQWLLRLAQMPDSSTDGGHTATTDDQKGGPKAADARNADSSVLAELATLLEFASVPLCEDDAAGTEPFVVHVADAALAAARAAGQLRNDDVTILFLRCVTD